MPSYDQLNDEAAWQDEVGAPAIIALGKRLTGFWDGAQVWVRGDNSHLRGYHRSRRWIQTSMYCTDRTYSVSRTSGDRNGGDSNWACALDLGGLSQEDLMEACRRLDAACRAGKLEKITEWFGNLNGDTRVDGWNNIDNRPASSDSSHLTHLHLSFDRGRANEDHDDVFQILTGEDMSWDEVIDYPGTDQRNPNGYPAGQIQIGTNQAAYSTLAEVKNLKAMVEKLATVPVDYEKLALAMRAIMRDTVRAELDSTKLTKDV